MIFRGSIFKAMSKAVITVGLPIKYVRVSDERGRGGVMADHTLDLGI